jgi:hypothetical protein
MGDYNIKYMSQPVFVILKVFLESKWHLCSRISMRQKIEEWGDEGWLFALKKCICRRV